MKLLDKVKQGKFDWIKGQYRFGFTYFGHSKKLGIESLSKQAKTFFVYYHFWFISFYVWKKFPKNKVCK